LAACLITALAAASVYLSQSIFPAIAQSYGLPDGAARLTFTCASIAYALAFFVMGPLSDLIAPRTLATAGLAGTALGLALGASSTHFALLLLAMVLTGTAAAAVPATVFALLPRMVPPARLVSSFGLVIAASVCGISLGRAVPGLLTQHLGWRGAFFAIAAVTAAAIALARVLPQGEQARPARRASLPAIYLEALGLLVAPRLLRLFIAGAGLFFGYLGCATFLTYRLHQAPLSLNGAQIGALNLLGLISLIGAPLSGVLVRRLGAPAVALACLLLAALGIVVLGQAQSLHGIGAGMLLMFLGVFACQPAIFAMITGRVRPEQRGTASSMYMLICLGAGSAASWSLGPVWASAGFGGVVLASAAAVALGAGTVVLDRLSEREVGAIAAKQTAI
jgi:YNFM family putative membrane transporter